MSDLEKMSVLLSNKFKQVKRVVWVDRLTGERYLTTDAAYSALLNKINKGKNKNGFFSI